MTITNELFKSTIETSEYFTMAESLILIKILDQEYNNMSLINPRDLRKELNLSHTSIYNAINKLKAKGFILKLSTHKNGYRVNRTKLEQLYKITQDLNILKT